MRDRPAARPAEAASIEALAAATERLTGRRPTRIEPVPAGLGDRRFHRLHFAEGAPSTLIARVEADSPLATAASRPRSETTPASSPQRIPDAPPWLPEPPLEPIRSLLAEHGLPVPESYGHDAAARLDLLEDLGPRTLLDLEGEAAAERYREACGLLPRLQSIRREAADVPAFGRRLDRALVATKAWKWLHWTLPLVLGREASAEETTATHAFFDHVARLCEDAPGVLAHRDFKAENLHLAPPARAGEPERLVMIDVQGAFLAPPEYDLVCLLCDLQTEVPPALVEALREATRPALPSQPGVEAFAERFDALAIARLCKDVSHVAHAALVRGDGRRWRELPRGLALLRQLAGRRRHTFPGLRALHSVIPALTAALDSADSPEAFRAQTGR